MGMIFWKNYWRNIQIKNFKLFEYLTDENDCVNGMKVGKKQMKSAGYEVGVKERMERRFGEYWKKNNYLIFSEKHI